MVVVCPVPRRHGSSKTSNALLVVRSPGTCWGEREEEATVFKTFPREQSVGPVRRGQAYYLARV